MLRKSFPNKEVRAIPYVLTIFFQQISVLPLMEDDHYQQGFRQRALNLIFLGNFFLVLKI
jgi:hypothetical protein